MTRGIDQMLVLGGGVAVVDIYEAKQQELGGFVVNLDKIIGIKASSFSPKEDPTIKKSTTITGEDRAASCVLKATEIDIKAINASYYIKLKPKKGYCLSTLFNRRCTSIQSTINKRYTNIFCVIFFSLDVLCTVLPR